MLTFAPPYESLEVVLQTIISLQPLTHQGQCTRLHGVIFRKKAVILVFALGTVTSLFMFWLASQNYVDSIQYFTPSLNVKFGGCTALGIRIMTAYFSGLDKGSGATQ